MHFLENFYFKALKYDLANKFVYDNTNKIPKLKKIILNFGSKTADIKQLSSGLLAFELIANQRGILTKTKKSNILLKIRKGNPTGCKLTLQKYNLFNLFKKTIFEVFPKLKNFNGFTQNRKIKKNTFSYELHDTFSFSELEGHYYFFNNLPKLDITIITTAKNKKELIFVLKSLQFPFKNKY
jgi:large subunit ribosomal protein L5